MKYLNKYEYFVYDEKRIPNTLDVKNRFVKSMVKLTEDEAFDYVIKNCNEWLEYPVKIGRRIQTTENCFYSKPVDRISRDCENYYTLIMDNAPEWKDYPKRSKSFICSLLYSNMNGNAFVVIPNDNSIWGVCNEVDIYDSFINGMDAAGWMTEAADNFVDRILDISKKFNVELSQTNYEDLHKGIDEIEKKLKEFKNNRHGVEVKYIGEDDIDYEEDFINFMSKNAWKKLLHIFSPEINRFKLLNLQQLYQRGKYGIHNTRNEIWSESTCLFIQGQHNTMQKIPLLEKLKSNGKMNELI